MTRPFVSPPASVASPARARLRATRRQVMATIAVRAVAWGAVVAGTALAAVAVLDTAVALPVPVRGAARLAALALGALVSLWRLTRGIRSARYAAVAMFVEEAEPGLKYALVTWEESWEEGRREVREELEAEIAKHGWEPAVRRTLWRSALAPAAALAAVAVAALLLPAGARARVLAPHEGDLLDRATAPAGTRVSVLRPLVAVVTPPAYTGLPSRTLDEPSEIGALVLSGIEIRGRSPQSASQGRVSAWLDAKPVTVEENGARWRVSLTMPARPGVLRLQDHSAGDERLIVLAPRPDSAPTVTLDAPARDTVLRSPSGRIALHADAADDLGLVSGAFEFIVSSGEGESFTFRSGRIGARAFGGVRSGSLSTVLALDSLRLAAGDVVHLRAVARDANDVPGAEAGASDTRTIRIARVGEYDSVAVEGAPPPEADQSVLSQRMLILEAEALEARRPRLTRPRVVDESGRLGKDQARLRRLVGEIIFARLGGQPRGEESSGDVERAGTRSAEELLRAADSATGGRGVQALDFEGDESPVVAVNRPLLEAYNAMWDATRELDAGEPALALPPMRAALAAIQRARQAERIYLRGRPPAVVVDLARVRLQGRDPGSSSVRAAREPVDDPGVRRARRLAAALMLLEREPRAAIDSLVLARVDALADDPALAAALGAAVDALRAGRDATGALVRARRLAGGGVLAADSLSRWSGR